MPEPITITITLSDTHDGCVIAHTTMPAATLGQRLTPAAALALDLLTQASHRAQVVHMQVMPQQPDTDTRTLNVPLDDSAS